MVAPLRVVYFTIVGLVPQGKNGGSICCRNHLERIAGHRHIECHAFIAGPEAMAGPSLEYANSVAQGARYFAYSGNNHTISDCPAGASYLSRRWPYMHELDALGERNLARQVARDIRALSPDVIVVDYLFSALFIEDIFDLGVPVITLTLNREGEFYRDLRERQMSFYGTPASYVAELRLRSMERRIYRKSRKVISIGKFDLPRLVFDRKKAIWVPPYLDASPDRWRFTDASSFFFIGNQHHYPNRMAIEWLAERFSPEFLRLAPDAKINIVGMSEDEAPPSWRQPNMVFHGYGDDEMAARFFREGAALLAPISNNFGAKFKVLEAVAHGTPVLASCAALSGASFLDDVPLLDLDDPAAAAAVAATFCEERVLWEASRSVSEALQRHSIASADQWHDLLTI